MALLTDDAIRTHLESLAGWESRDNALVKTYTLGSFVEGIVLMAAIAQLAEAAGHHPDLNLHSYRKLTATLSTHSEGGVTIQDVELARQIDRIPQVRRGP